MTLNLNQPQDANARQAEAQTAQSAQQPPRQPEKTMSTQQQGYNPFTYAGMQQGANFQLVQPNSGSALFAKITEVMGKTLAANGVSEMYDVMAFPRENHKILDFSVLVVIRNNKVPLGQGRPRHNYVVGQIFIVASTGELPKRSTDTSTFRRPVTVISTVEDAFNNYLTKYVSDAIRDKYQAQDLDVMLLDPVVIPAEVNITDDSYITQLLSSAARAVETRSQARVPGFQDYNFIVAHGGSDLEMPVSVDQTAATHHDLTNRPIYADAVISVAVESAQTRNFHQRVMNSNTDSKPVCDTLVMTDLVPCEVDLLEDNRGARSRKFEPEVAWAPRLTVRHIDQYLTGTLSGVMFGVASIAELARNRDWATTFRQPRGAQRATENLRDIGFLNIEANIGDEDGPYGTPINTASSDFGDRDLGQLLDATVAKDPILALDCYTTGPNAYMTTPLALAARGGRDVREAANREILHSMNCATNGNLAEVLGGLDIEVVEGRGDLIHVGHWYDSDRKRDVAELDTYLAMAVIGGVKNPQLAQDWMRTYYSDEEEAVRMSERLQLLESASTGTLTVTGTALRVSINPKLIAAFVEAMSMGKLPLVSRSGDGDLFTTRRSVSSIAGRSVYRGDGFGRTAERAVNRSAGRYAAQRY